MLEPAVSGLGTRTTHNKEQALVLWFEEVGISDIPLVGGKMPLWEK